MLRFYGLQRTNRFGFTGILAVAILVLAGGCMRIPRAPLGPPHWAGSAPQPTDPFLDSQPQVVPQQQPTEVTPVPDDGPQPTFDNSYSAPVPVESNRPVPTPLDLPADDYYVNPNVEPPLLEVPTIVPQAVTVPPVLALEVKAPKTNLVGEVTVFEVTLQNKGDDPATEVVVESKFEEGFIFPGSTDRQVSQTVGTLQPGDSREIKLSLRSDRAGYHCVEFSLRSKEAKTLTKKVCVEYRDSTVSLEVNGPAKRMVNGNAEWNLTVLSQDFLPVTNANVTVEYDSTYLKPIGGSEGAKQELGRITWPLGMLQASERVELQVEFQCLMPVDSTCLTVNLTADTDVKETTKSCLAIERRVGALDIDLRDAPDPLKVGEESEYIITIANRGLQTVHDLRVTAALPAMFRATSFEVREGQQPLSGIDASVEGSLAKFDSVDVLAPDAKLTFRIKVKALQAGTDRLLLSISSDDDTSGKIRLEEVTTVVN